MENNNVSNYNNNNSNSSNDSNRFLRILLLIAFIFFEVYAGVRLLTDPEGFTNSVIIIFGIVMVVIGVISLIRALRAKSYGVPSTLGLVGALVDLAIGIVCLVFSKNVIKLFPVLAMIYGIFMVIMGINKMRQWAVLHDFKVPRAWILLVSAILSIVLGIIIFLNPFTTTEVVWMWTAIFLIVTGVIDLFALIFSFFI